MICNFASYKSTVSHSFAAGFFFTILCYRNVLSYCTYLLLTVPITTFMFLWAIYIFPWSVCLFCRRKIGGPNEGIYRSLTDTWMWKLEMRPRNRSQKQECRNWEWGRAFPLLGTHKSKFLCNAITFQRLIRSGLSSAPAAAMRTIRDSWKSVCVTSWQIYHYFEPRKTTKAAKAQDKF